MRRRSFLSALATATAAATGGRTFSRRALASTDGRLSALEFDSTASLLDADYAELTDETIVAVWAEDTATNEDGDGDGYGVVYADSTPIPLVASERGVVGFGAMLVDDGTDWQRGNEEFVLNVWDAEVDGEVVLWDEGHGQYYALSEFSEFRAYAEDNGYDVRATSDLAADLDGADAAVVTSPSAAFGSDELDALADFVAADGALFLHDQSDYENYDETANLNDVPGRLGLSFRFNDDQVLDEIRNGGQEYEPTTESFNDDFDYFAEHEGLGLDPAETYTVPVTEVLDGDTVAVDLDGTEENVRVLGMDTPETSSNSQYERTQEWEGIEDTDHLETWASRATDFGKAELGGETVDLRFDPNEPVRDAFGRLLGYVHYDNGSGSRDALYNRRCVAEGYARVYDSGFSKHESFWNAEAAARADGVGLWAESAPENSDPIRNRDVDDLFFPKAASVRAADGRIDGDRVPVFAESTAGQEGGDVSYDRIPLVGVDEAVRVAVIGGELVDESYEADEGYAADTSTFENFVFITNLIDSLSARTGDVLVDGGHGQFGATFGLSAEDAAYYGRYLEGQGIDFEGVNALTADNLSRGRALIVTTPAEEFTREELDAVAGFAEDGGAVILVGTGWTSDEARGNLNAVASALGTDLQLSADRVTDEASNVDDDPTVLATTDFDDRFDLFDAYDRSESGEEGELTIVEIHEDAEGDDWDNLDDEYVVFGNDGDSALDLTDWQVRDEAEKTYTFPAFVLDAGAEVTLYTGEGEDTQTELYWDSGSPVWNNEGDTVYVSDADGTLVVEESY
ncbi:DUF4350 domain-containing protein [Halegenticoccus tardaugens]|uniref:DUF4350 domain-containing protein n=1 Tax=Halegenticoccus tardaugens TaxID=2071624 RepID=UPI00100C236D|nr:DUF4350 domain-containing protein [Halegenticoccus tardaugens]